MDRQLLKEYIHIIIERKSDDDFFAVAHYAFNEISMMLRTQKGLESFDDYHVALKLPTPPGYADMNNIRIIMTFDDEYYGSSGVWNERNKEIALVITDYMRAKLGIQKFNLKNPDQLVEIFKVYKNTFIHELRHAYDDLVRKSPKFQAWAVDSKSTKKREKAKNSGDPLWDRKMYANQEHELNAVVTQAIDLVIHAFENENEKRTKQSANAWIPNTAALIQACIRASTGIAATEPDWKFKDYVDEKKWLRRAAPRIVAAWHNYVERLPNE